MDRSVDRKARAAGERDDELPQRPQTEPLHEYAREALDHLLIFTRAEMSGTEQALWVGRLSKYPKWKLSKLADFAAPFITEVWNFLDKLQPEPEYYQASTTYPQIEHKSQIHKDVLKHVTYLYEIAEPIHHARSKLHQLQERQKLYPSAQEYTVPLALAEKNLKESIRLKRQRENETLIKLQETYKHIKFI